MKKTYIFILALCISVSSLAQSLNESYKTYIEKYSAVAVRQMQNEGIPASIIMAQALLESSAGSSYLALKANNHFGIKCTSDWNGPSVTKDDDKKNECFRKYSHPEESFTDHSAFLKRDRYASLYKIPSTDYKAWAKGLKAAGYATDSQYAEKLIRIIENYSLHKLDTQSTITMGEAITAVGTPEDASYNSSMVLYHKNKGIPYVIMGKDDTLEGIAKMYKKSYPKLMEYNDMRHDTPVKAGSIIFLAPKKTKGLEEFYVIKAGDTMYSISQKEGMTLASLYEKNRLKVGVMPPVGTRLYLHKKVPKKYAKNDYNIL